MWKEKLITAPKGPDGSRCPTPVLCVHCGLTSDALSSSARPASPRPSRVPRPVLHPRLSCIPTHPSSLHVLHPCLSCVPPPVPHPRLSCIPACPASPRPSRIPACPVPSGMLPRTAEAWNQCPAPGCGPWELSHLEQPHRPCGWSRVWAGYSLQGILTFAGSLRPPLPNAQFGEAQREGSHPGSEVSPPHSLPAFAGPPPPRPPRPPSEMPT